MKKVILIAAIAVFGMTNANAQEETTTNKGFAKGDVFISGSVGISSQKTGEAKTTGFEIGPKAGFFVSENIAVGAQIGYTKNKSEVDGTDISDVSQLSFGAFGRYYFMPASAFSLFGELGVEYRSAEDNIDDAKVNGFGAVLAPGISYFVSEHFALEATFGILGYSTSEPDSDGAESTDTFSFGLDMSDINLGIVYKF